MKKKYIDLNVVNFEENVQINVFINNLETVTSHLFKNYYFNSSNLSINLKCELQWIKYGWNFFEIIKKILNDKKFIQNYLTYDSVLRIIIHCNQWSN